MSKFRNVSSDHFGQVFTLARELNPVIKGATSAFEDDGSTSYYLAGVENKVAGYAIRGDGELVYVFSTVKGHGDTLVADAVANSATHLDCFDEYLPGLYARHGFQTVATVPNWTDGEPDVVYMSLPGFESRHGF